MSTPCGTGVTGANCNMSHEMMVAHAATPASSRPDTRFEQVCRPQRTSSPCGLLSCMMGAERLHFARIHAIHGLLLRQYDAHQKTRGTRTHGTSLKFRRKRSLRSQQRGQTFAQHGRQTGWARLHGMGAWVHKSGRSSCQTCYGCFAVHQSTVAAQACN